MSMQVRPIQNSYSVHNGHMPQIFNFSDHYKARHGVKPGEGYVNNPPKSTAHSKSSLSSTHGEPPDGSFFENNKTLPAIMLSFLASTALTFGAHTTSTLDSFGDTAKKLIQCGLNFITVVLGATAAGGYLNTLSNDSELEEKGSSYLFD